MLFSKCLAFFAALGASFSTPAILPNDQNRLPHANGAFIAAEAMYVNIFAQLSTEEENGVRAFLDAHRNTSAIGDFSTVMSLNALPPNKTVALAYLDGIGAQPPRYAQATLRFHCSLQEWMIGPLPISNATTATRLDFMYNGNATMKLEDCNLLGGRASVLRASNEPLGRSGEQMVHDDLTAPIAVAPDGARYEFDPRQNYVSWMDFSFFVALSHNGVGLYDIRFKGQRIAYELVLQEALAHYAGVTRSASETAYLDSYYGWNSGELVPGFDCPSYATYTDTFCLFEYPKDFPLQRHSRDSSGYYHVTKNIAFMVRSVVTVDNYDYQLTFEFGLDGAIQVITRASGYALRAPWNNAAEDHMFGVHISEGWSGAMHDHVLNFKLDLDVNGTANSLYKTEFKNYERTVPWSNSTFNTMRLERGFVENEVQGKIHWDANSAASYAVVNKDTPNAFGEFPGWKIYPSTGASISLTVQNSTVLGSAGNWATHPLYAVKRKDSEQTSSYRYGILNTQKPLVNFDNFFDGESLDQEDIVIYFNLGMHHLPDTYDLPNTMFSGAQSGITIRPQNYGTSNPGMATRQMVEVRKNWNASAQVEYYGQKLPSGTLDLDAENVDLSAIMS